MADTADGDRWTIRDVPQDGRSTAVEHARRRDEKLGGWVYRAIKTQAAIEDRDGIFPPGAPLLEPSAEPPPMPHHPAPLLLPGPSAGLADGVRDRASLAMEVLRAGVDDEVAMKMARGLLRSALRAAKPPKD
jgi:hypothetical protein